MYSHHRHTHTLSLRSGCKDECVWEGELVCDINNMDGGNYRYKLVLIVDGTSEQVAHVGRKTAFFSSIICPSRLKPYTVQISNLLHDSCVHISELPSIKSAIVQVFPLYSGLLAKTFQCTTNMFYVPVSISCQSKEPLNFAV